MFSIADLVLLYKNYAATQCFTEQPQSLYDPVNYILSIGGKQLRPALVLMAHNLFDEKVKQSLPASHAVEIFHNFTLLHDDIMDGSSVRRGKPTVHVKYNTSTAILSGDVMMIQSYRFLAQATTNNATFKAIFAVFTKTAIEICEGQQYDIDFETRSDVTIPNYLQMIELKTAVLLGAALQIGAIIGGANQQDAGNIYEFGRNLGIAFQIQDDILDTFGDQATFGKRIGGDILNNKKTILLLTAQKLADSEQKTALQRWLDFTPKSSEDEAQKIEAVTHIFSQLNIRELVELRRNEFYTIGLNALNAINVSHEKKYILRDFAENLMARKT
ncbi:MAG: hypothetical protein RI894_92 [Bacteroidota bacterium]|jgi:geranylgeranyl diphosphate synthase type II